MFFCLLGSILFFFSFFFLSDGKGICQKRAKKGKTPTQTAGRQTAIAGAGLFTQSLFGMVQKKLPDNDE
jgi:hypothetical protein